MCNGHGVVRVCEFVILVPRGTPLHVRISTWTERIWGIRNYTDVFSEVLVVRRVSGVPAKTVGGLDTDTVWIPVLAAGRHDHADEVLLLKVFERAHILAPSRQKRPERCQEAEGHGGPRVVAELELVHRRVLLSAGKERLAIVAPLEDCH